MKSSSLTLEDIQKEIFEAEVYLNKSHTYISSFGDEGKFENNNNDGSFIQYEKDIGESYKEYLQQYQLSANYSSLYLDDHLSSDDNHLTFNPSLPETSNQIVACMKGRYFPPHQRLYDEAKVKDDKLITLNLRLDELRIQTITHRPKLNNFMTTRSPTFQPLHERVPDILKERDLKRRMKEEIESIEHSRLKCKSFNTRSVPANTSDPIELLDVSTRLLMRGKLMEERRLRQIQDAEEKLSETIRPPILTGHKVTAALIAAGNSVLSANFIERQAIYASKNMARQLIHSRGTDDDETLFTPTTNQKSTFILASERPRLLSETADEKYFRLSKTESERIQEKKLQFAEKIQQLECTFMPTINASSRKLASDHTFHDLINDKRRRHAHQELLKQEQDSFRNACTFQPKLCEGTRTKVSNNRNNSDISLIHGTLDPALIIDSTRLYRQSQTISTHKTTEDDNECTFSPRISYPRQKLSTQPVLVNGLNRHLQLQTMALQKSQDIEERQRQAFHPDFRKYRDEENRTVIQPFNLTRSQNSSKQK